jgi:ParB family chromosome partitioning protein
MNKKKETLHRKTSLGRGLNALLGDSSYFMLPGTGNDFREISVEQIAVNPLQPRQDFNPESLQELVQSIQVHGIIQPLTVRQIAANSYQLISGERRFQAAKKAGLKQVPAYIRTANDQEMLEMALIENIQRENLNPIEIALSYQRLLSECDIKQEILGSRVGKDRTTVNNYLRLLKLPPDIQIALRDQKITMGHARALINLKTIDIQLKLLQETIEQELSVRKVEELVRAYMEPRPSKSRKKKQTTPLSNTTMIAAKISTHLKTAVKIRVQDSGEGELRIAFINQKDLDRITKILSI